MIPYDDLVIALQTWRAKQGLPVAQMSGQLTPPPAAVAPAAPAFSSGPPTPPPKASYAPPAAPAETHEDSLDVDGALIEEAHYENEGSDFAMAFGNQDAEDSTSIGSPPGPRVSDSTLDENGTEIASPGARRGGPRGNNDW